MVKDSTKTITVNVRVNNSNLMCDTTLRNNASVTTTTLEPDTSNNSAYVDTKINGCAPTTATLIVKKVVATTEPSNFSFLISGNTAPMQFETDGQNEITVTPGTYSVTEVSTTGYSATYDNCKDVVLTGGDTKTCTITNTRDTGTLKVIKTVDDKSDLTKWSFSLDGGEPVSADSLGKVDFGKVTTGDTHTITEYGPKGYTLTSVTGTNCIGDLGNNGTSATVETGKTTTCTFNNEKDMGTLKVVKVVDDKSDLTKWSFSLDGNTAVYANSLGEVDFGKVTTLDTHTIVEYGPANYEIVSVTGENCTEDLTNNRATAVVDKDSTTTCTFNNSNTLGSISGHKYHDIDLSNTFTEGDTALPNWTIFIDENENGILDGIEKYTTTDTLGEYTFSGLVAGNYRVCEVIKTDWYATDRTCYDVRVSKKDVTKVDFFNYKKGSISGYKFRDLNENGEFDEGESVLSNWMFTLEQRARGEEGYDWIAIGTSPTNSEGQWLFSNLEIGQTYRVNEVLKDGWKQTNTPYVMEGFSLEYSGESLEDIYFGNNVVAADLYLSKTNNALTTKKVGDTVEYTMIVRAETSDVLGVKVIDLLPQGFKYKLGSYKAVSSDRGLLSISEPTYHSPGTWTLGILSEGEEVTLTYEATIEDSVDAGNYKDMALAKGMNANEEGLLAQAENPGYVAVNFVGTNVEVDKEIVPTTDTVDVKEKEVEREVIEEVLGASNVRLPATGASNWSIYMMILMFVTGIIMLMQPKLKKTLQYLTIAMLLATPIAKAETTSVNVRLEEPAAAYNTAFDLTYVALSSAGENVTVTCYKKAPGDSGFIAFTSPKALLKGGDTGTCPISSSLLIGSGTYQFRVKAETLEETAYSETVSTVFDNVGPNRPDKIEKNRTGACDYEITVKTSNDPQTSYVEIYASNDKEIEISDLSRVKTITMGPDEEQKFTYSVYSTDCAETFYFATRAFDSAKNPSDPRTEEIEDIKETVIKKEVKKEGEEVVAAIEVTTQATQEGSILGDKTSGTQPSGETLGDTTTASIEPEVVEDQGGFIQNLLKNKLFLVTLLLIGGLLVNDYRNKKKNSR